MGDADRGSLPPQTQFTRCLGDGAWPRTCISSRHVVRVPARRLRSSPAVPCRETCTHARSVHVCAIPHNSYIGRQRCVRVSNETTLCAHRQGRIVPGWEATPRVEVMAWWGRAAGEGAADAGPRRARAPARSTSARRPAAAPSLRRHRAAGTASRPPTPKGLRYCAERVAHEKGTAVESSPSRRQRHHLEARAAALLEIAPLQMARAARDDAFGAAWDASVWTAYATESSEAGELLKCSLYVQGGAALVAPSRRWPPRSGHHQGGFSGGPVCERYPSEALISQSAKIAGALANHSAPCDYKSSRPS